MKFDLLVERFLNESHFNDLKQKANQKGYNIGPVYHGSNIEKLYKFNRSKEGAMGSGIYLTTDKGESFQHGTHSYNLFINLKNPYDCNKGFSQLKDPEYKLRIRDASDINLPEIFKEFGYDGLVRITNTGTTHYVVFDNIQVKSADEITYDDNNKPIPIEQRFDSSKDDIRY